MPIEKKEIAKIVDQGRIFWQRNSLERMLERGISRKDVINVLSLGEIIESYSTDQPYPSVLMLGFVNEDPIHVVVALNNNSDRCYVITAYKPDSRHFESDFRTRKK